MFKPIFATMFFNLFEQILGQYNSKRTSGPSKPHRQPDPSPENNPGREYWLCSLFCQQSKRHFVS